MNFASQTKKKGKFRPWSKTFQVLIPIRIHFFRVPNKDLSVVLEWKPLLFFWMSENRIRETFFLIFCSSISTSGYSTLFFVYVKICRVGENLALQISYCITANFQCKIANNTSNSYLGLSSHLHKRVCLSVHPSIRISIRLFEIQKKNTENGDSSPQNCCSHVLIHYRFGRILSPTRACFSETKFDFNRPKDLWWPSSFEAE